MTPEHRAALKQAVDARRRELAKAPADGIIHGEYAYRCGCRCDECRRTANEQRRRRIQRDDARAAPCAEPEGVRKEEAQARAGGGLNA